ncbi:MAG TPA: sodium/solute symporter [Vicinamibacterales bacterium]|jgi:SSS family transporter|nr:sodium/solute symporter [Vicinamibacterales bacterium]
MPTSLHAVDAAIVVAYLAVLAVVGVYFSRRQTTLDEFFRARQTMAWVPVGLSLMAALNSGIDYLMQPASTIRYGLILLVGTSSWLFVYPWVSRVTLPFYRRLGVFTAYEFLEARFDVRVRMLAAGIFIVWRLGWMATAIYVPCLAINAATGGRADLTTMILVLGALVTVYTMLGGIQAVIWNDVIQFCIMFGGLAATVWISLANVPGGLAEIWSVASHAGKTSLATPIAVPAGAGVVERVSLFFAQPINVTAILCALVFGRMASYTSDQVMVQRFQTTRSVADSRRAFVINAAGDVVWMFGLSFVGLALLAYFSHHPLPADVASDKILPYFMTQAFPAGAVGLVVAAILAASLSSIDSAINSCTSVMVIDGYQRLFRSGAADQDGRRQVLVSRVMTVAFGALGTVLATNVSRIGTLLEIANKLINAFAGPLFGIYLLAMFNRRATAAPVLAAGVVGSLTSYYVAYHSGIGFMWPSTFGLVATVATGSALAAVTSARPTAAALRLTWREVVRGDHQAEVEHVRHLR